MKDNWIRLPLGELVTIQKGKISEQSTYPIKGFAPIINTDVLRGDIKVWGRVKGSVNCVEDDVLILWDGERSGLCAIGYNGVVGSTFAKMNVSNELVPEYLFRVVDFNFDWIQGQRTGTGVPHVPKDLKTIFKVNYPPLPQQKKIAKILSTVDNVIEKTESAIAKYQAIKQGLMHDLFTRGIDVNTGKLRPTPQEAPELYKESVLGLIPRDWELDELNNYCYRISVGIATSSSKHVRKSGVLFLRNQNIKENYIDLSDTLFITREFAEINKSKYLKTGDVITVRTGYPGISAVVEESLKGSQTFTTLITTPNPEHLNSNFLSYFINSKFGKEQIFSLQGGGAQQNLNSKALELMQMIKPHIEEQNLILQSINALDSKIKTEQQALAKYQQLKAGLLQDLLTGKVEVSVE